ATRVRVRRNGVGTERTSRVVPTNRPCGPVDRRNRGRRVPHAAALADQKLIRKTQPLHESRAHSAVLARENLMISVELKNVLLRELALPQYDFQDHTLANQVPGWDSLKHVSVIAAVEDAFGIR